ncbi:MAG: CPBP family intramembrane metalloprotease [Clostridia bacterium]|nr:CPBP family intramembrane metalloprotease [Clostridia bacterium]
MKESVKRFYHRLPEDMDLQLQKQWSRYFLKRDASVCALGVLLITAMQLVCSPLVGLLESALMSVGAYNQVVEQCISSLFYIAYMGLPFTVVALVSQRKLPELVHASRPKKYTFLPMLLIGLGVVPVLQYAAAGLDWALELVALDTYQPVLDQAFAPVSDPAAMAVQYFQTAVLAAFFEEFAFRGVMLQMLRRYGDGFAVVCSAILFGVMHGNTYQIPYTILFGLVMGAVVVWTDSIWTGVALHFGNNFVAFLITFITQDMSNDTANLVAGCIWAATFALGIVGAIIALVRRAKGTLPRLTRKQPEMPADRRYSAFFSAPLVIIVLVVNLLSALLLTTLVQELIPQLMR